MSIKVGHINLMALGTVTASSTATGYPMRRLFDGFLGRFWQAGGAGSASLYLAQPAADIRAASCLAIAPGHNLTGSTITLLAGTTEENRSEVADIEVSGSGIILLEFDSVTLRYWRIKIENVTPAPQIGELYLGRLIEVEAPPEQPKTSLAPNFRFIESPAGVSQLFVQSDAREQCDLSFPRIKNNEVSVFKAWASSYAAGRIFVFVSFDETSYFATFKDAPEFTYISSTLTGMRCQVVEVL